jgi:hypothetical protein
VSCEFNEDEEEVEVWLWIEEERSWVVVAEPLTPQFDLETLWRGRNRDSEFLQLQNLLISFVQMFV